MTPSEEQAANSEITTHSSSPTVDFVQRIQYCLSRINAPAIYDSAWLGPFEQLVGAAFSLIESEKRGLSSRLHSSSYHRAVQCKIVNLLSELEEEKQSTDKDALGNWLSRYYFNSGMQRINFAAERLIATFAALSCVCSRSPEITVKNNRAPRFPERLEAAKARLQHVESEYPPALTNFKTMLGQLGVRYERNDAFDTAKGLAMIRQDVNSRKHSTYKRSETLDAMPRPASGTIVWANSGFHARMQTSVVCLELVSQAYSELCKWFPMAKF